MSTYTAKRLPRHKGTAAWNAILPPAPAATPLEADTTADVAIIGAGFAGLSAARRLRQLRPEAKITLLDAHRVAEGAAGRNSGFMIDLPHDLQSDDYAGDAAERDHLITTFNRQAIAFGRAAVQEYGITPDFFDECGKVNGAAGEAAHAHNLSYARHLEALGESFEALDARAMADLTGSHFYRSGIFTPGGAVLQPAGYVRGLATGLARDGVQIHENSPVTAITRSGPDWRITANGHHITAPQVILATNGHLESFGIAKGRLMHIILFAAMTEELPQGALPGAPRWGVTPSDPMGTTMRRIDPPLGGNRIITRSCTEFRPGMEASATGLNRATRLLRQKFDARFPTLTSVKMEYIWAGHLCLTRNAVSVTGDIEPGLFSACVQNGLGAARGTLTGIAAAEVACDHASPIRTYFTTEDAPTKLPPDPIATIGANALLRWKEHRARSE